MFLEKDTEQKGYSKKTKMIVVALFLGLAAIAALMNNNLVESQQVAIKQEETQEMPVFTAIATGLTVASGIASLFGGSARQPWPDEESKKQLGELRKGQGDIMQQVQLTDRLAKMKFNELGEDVQREHGETRNHVTRGGRMLQDNINKMKSDMVMSFGEIQGVSLETRKQLSAKLDQSLEATTAHIDKRTTMVVNEIGKSTDSILSKTSQVEGSINGNLESLESDLSNQLTETQNGITNHFNAEIRNFKVEMGAKLDVLKADTQANFDTGKGNQQIMKEDLRFLRDNMMKNLDYSRQRHYGRDAMVTIINTFEQAHQDLTEAMESDNETYKLHMMTQLKDRVSKTEYQITDAKAYLGQNMIEENIKDMKEVNIYDAALQVQSYNELIAYVHCLETMRISFLLDGGQVSQTIVTQQLDRADRDRDTFNQGLTSVVETHMMQNQFDVNQSNGSSSSKLVWTGKMFKDRKDIWSRSNLSESQAIDQCMGSVTSDNGCDTSAFTLLHQDNKSYCFCVPKGSNGGQTKTDSRVKTYQVTKTAGGFEIQSDMCDNFQISSATPKILTMCSNYHKFAQNKYLAARDRCSANMPFFRAYLSQHYDNNMSVRDDLTCALEDGPTTNFCACLKQHEACHLQTFFDGGNARGIRWVCEK